MKLIFGLGNCETKFDDTPHNSGFMVVNNLAQQFNVEFKKKKLSGLVAETNFCGQKILLIKPQTYMNNSGECVFKFVKKFKVDLKDVVIIYDDIDLPLGSIRYRENGSAGTHNGMRNVVDNLGTTDIKRIRVGVGKPPENVDLADFVLTKFKDETLKNLQKGVILAAEKAVEFLKEK